VRRSLLRGFELCECSESFIIVRLSADSHDFSSRNSLSGRSFNKAAKHSFAADLMAVESFEAFKDFPRDDKFAKKIRS